MKAQRLAAVLIVGAVIISTGAGVLLYTGGNDIGSNFQADGSNSTSGDVTALNQSSDGMVYLDVAPSSERNRTDLEHALIGLYDEKSINVSSIELVDSQRDASTVALATDGQSNATYIATWTERHLDQQATNADSGSSNHSEAASSQARCGVEPAYYQLDFVAGEPIENLQGPEGTYTPDELIRFAHSNSERNDIRRSSNGEFTTNDTLRNAVDSQSISVENGTATVSFSISEDSDPIELTLASYTKPQQVWTRATESEQEFVDGDTRTFKPGGSYTLSVDLPNSKIVPCETDTDTDTAPKQPAPSTETDTPESPDTTQTTSPSGTPETTTSGTTTSDTTTSGTTTSDTTTSGTTTSDTTTSGTTTSDTTTSGTTTPDTTTPETTNPGTTEEPSTTTPPTTTPPTETPPAADLSITKTVDDANATVGDNVTFTVEVTNNGPDAASNVTVNEMLGSGLAFQSGEVSQGVYDPGTGVYSVGTLANGETATLEITATIESVDNTTNAVEVTSDQPDPNDPNNNDSATPSPETADLSLTKNVNASAPNVGENIAYTLTLTNDGPNATSNVTVADALPDGLSFVSASASQGEYNNGTGLWTVNSLSDGGEATLTIVATADTTDDVTNIAEVNSSETFDPDSTPNNDDPDEDDRGSTTTNGQSSDLSVTKTVKDSNVTVGENVTFTVEVTNNGPDAATNVSVNEMLGNGLSFQNASTTQGSYDETTNVYDVGTLDNGETATLTLTATIESPTDTTNAVEVTSETPDPNGPNNNETVDPTPAVADLSLTKSVNESAPNVGDNIAYTLTLTNDGPNATSNVTVADALPDGLSFVSSTASQGSYDNASGLWTVDDIASSDETTLSVVATVESTDDVTNVAEVNSSDTFDPNSTPNNNESDEDDQDSSTVNGQSADLAVNKTVNATDATVGDNVMFTVDVTNNGPDTATNVSVAESLGSGFTFQNASTTQGSYDPNSSVYTVGTLDSNETATLTLTATIASPDNTTNGVEVTGDQPDPNPPNNNETVDPSPSVADLSLTKNVNESAPNVGENVEYTLTLSNDGPNATSNVTVADALPDGVSYVSASASQGSYDNGTNLWTVNSIANDSEATLSVVATVENTDDITNIAEVNSSDTFDPDSTPNNDNPDEDDRGTTTINGQSADLAVSKSVNDTNVTVGDTVAFTVQVTNNGPDAATNVAVDEALGTGLAFQNATVSQGSYDNETNIYDVGTLASDETATLTLTATIESVDDTANAVEVTSETPDPNPPNNNETVDPTPAVADLSLTKNVNETTPNVGENVAYTLTLTNDGPNATANVTVADSLPNGLSGVSANASQGSYDTESGLWTVGELASGDQSTLTITATVQSTADVTNVAEVNSSDQFDPNSTPGNDEPGEDDQDNVTVNGQSADLAVNKTVEDENATVGDDVTFTVKVTNNGPDTATNVSVNESLGSGLSFVDASATQGEYNADTGVYSVGSLANGDTATLTLTATIESVDNTTNAVEVTSETSDPNDPNNNETVDPSPSVADLSLTKNVNESAPNVGENVAYTLTLTNDGPNATSNVTVADVLPDGVSYVSADASQGSYDASTGLWTVGDIASNGDATLTLTATVENTEDVTNVVEVNSSDTFDPNSTPNNNESDEDDQDNVTVNGQSADLGVDKTIEDGTNATVGDNVTFAVTVTNTGPDTATNVSVNESLGSGLAFQNATVTQGAYDETTDTYDIGTLASGGSATLTLTATIESPDNTTNAVEVTSGTPDPNQPNNNDSVDPSPSVADLSLTKDVNETAPNVGENVAYTLTLTNDGPNATSNVTVADVLPEGVTLVSADGSQGSYDGGTNLWTVGDIASNDTESLTLTTTVENTEDVTNVAEVNSSDTFDPDSTPNNNDSDEDDQDSVTVSGQSADLAVNKTVEATTATVGDNVTFTVDVTNNGPDTATNVSVNESLGSGLAFQNASTTQGEYDEEAAVYDVGTLESGDTATLTLTATIERAENTTNAVEVTGDQPDPNPPNNNDSANPMPTVADLSLTKNVNESAPNVGENVAYTLTLTNDGPNATSNVTVADALPEGVTFVSADAGQGSYNDATNLWTVNSLDDGGEATLTIVATVESTDDITNVAEVNASDTFDPDSTPNNDDPAEDDRGTTTINGQSADLAITKTTDDTDVTVGDNVTFTVEVTNNGPDTATGVMVNEMLGDGFSFQNASTTQGSYDTTTNTYDVGTLGSGETAALMLTATVESVENTTNAVEVTSGTPDPNDPNNNDSVDPTPRVADLALEKSVSDTTPNVGDNIEYTLTLSNDGPNATSNVTVADALPEGVTFVSSTASQGSYDDASGLWTVSEIASNDEATLTIVATVETTENVTNVAEVNSSDTFDPNSTPNNNESDENDQDNATINGQSADLAVNKTVENNNATVGDDVTFTVDVTNNGPDTATNVSVNESLGGGLAFQNASTTQGEYDPDSGVYSVGSLANGDTATLTLTATIESPDNTTNAVTVTSGTPDPNDPNNNDSVDPMPTVADLSLTKNVNESAPNVGENVEYTVTLSNAGPDDATNVTVTEALPDGLTVVSSDVSQGSYDSASGLWTVGDVSSGDEATLTIVATVDTTDDVTNTAQVNSSETFDPDSTPGNDEPGEDDQSSVTVNGQSADIAVNKTADDMNATVGDDVAFTVDVTNNGPDTATNVTVNESLGGGLAFQSASTTQGEYNESTSVYSVGTLETGETATLTLTATIESVNNTTNAVEATSDTPDPNPPNNNDSVTPMPDVADLGVVKTVDDTDATVGDDVTFTVDVTNNGPNTATNVSVNESLGDGLDFQSASVTQGEYNETTNVYAVGTLASGETATLTLTATIASAENTTNAVDVTGDQPDPNDPNNNDSVDPMPTVADLSLNKSVNDTSPNVGTNVAYTLNLSNTGPDAATSVDVTEALPDGLMFVSSTASQGSYDSASGLWTVGDISSGDEATLTIVATVESTDDVTNTAEVNASETFDPDSTPGNDEPGEDDQSSVTVNGQSADIAVNKTVGDMNATVGDDVTFTVDVTNNGPDTATNVSVDESLGDGLTFQSADVTQGEYDEGNNVYDVGTLDSGETATLTLTATIDSAENTTNAVEVTGDQPDPNPPNNNDSATPTPTAADLSLNKTVNESAPQTGAGIAYTLTLTNDGPNATSNVAVGDTLPAGVTFVSSNASQGTYDAGTGVWSVGDVGNEETQTLTIEATVDTAGNQTNTAQVTSSSTADPDSTPGNDDGGEDDQDSVTTQSTTPQCSIQLNNVTAPDSVSQGQQATITATVTNNGLVDDCGANATLNATGNSTRAVDIVFLLDRSGSTDPYLDKIANQLDDFATALDNQNIDARFAVISYGGNSDVSLDQPYTADSGQAINAIRGLNAGGGDERNHRAIEGALNALNPRPNANTFLIDVTDEDNDRARGDPTQTEIANQIDDAGATLIAVSPESDEIRCQRYPDGRSNGPCRPFNREDYDPSQDIKVLAQDKVRDGFWVNLFTDDESDDPNNLNNFVEGFEDIVIERVEEGINRDTSITLDSGESRTLSFTVDTSSFTPNSALDYTVTVEGETQTGTINITGSNSMQNTGAVSTSGTTDAASLSIASSPTSGTAGQDTTNETTTTPEMATSTSENPPNTTTATQTPTTESSTETATTETETATETPTAEPTETATDTVETTTETPTTTKTETATETTDTPTGASTETPNSAENTTVEASSSATNATPTSTTNTTNEETDDTETQNSTGNPSGTTEPPTVTSEAAETKNTTAAS